jgi:hypothetical protein
MIKLSQYVIGRLADWGVRHVFMVTGGGAMHLNDSVPMVVIFGHTSLSRCLTLVDVPIACKEQVKNRLCPSHGYRGFATLSRFPPWM